MKRPRKITAGLAVGAGVGVAASVANAAAAPSGLLAGMVAEAGRPLLQVASAAAVVADAGWVWAGAAVAAGWLVGTRAAGAAAGVLALVAATAAYYGMDSLLYRVPLGALWRELRLGWAPMVFFGVVLGTVGSRIGRPGLAGLLAGLMVPVGAAVEAALLPRYPDGSDAGAALEWVRLLIWAAAGLASYVVLVAAAVFRWRRKPGRPKLPPDSCI
ncbi:hypothetical protein [Arthrobacter mobilis]|uniref:Uncharacterized protein n=1 Tax=Arthrobacter mobilis TaxID=2724944 RepID=A0A7X6HCB6_9MICC|nr:hypothetical protein [Arthrobacter mobilis]NKX54492.1 hypothetical protein [Arthrobacter mobilis]